MIDYHKVDGLITEVEADFLAKLAGGVPEDGAIVNIGTWRGKSVACFLAGQPKAHVTTIDIDHSVERMPERIPDVEYITGDSGTIAPTWDKPIDLLFIDGSHSYPGVMADTGFADHVKVGGKVAFHDYDAFMHECTYAIDDWWADHRKSFRKIAREGYIIVYERVA